MREIAENNEIELQNKSVAMLNKNYNPNSKKCCVCLVGEANYIIYKCGHKILCETCAHEFRYNK